MNRTGRAASAAVLVVAALSACADGEGEGAGQVMSTMQGMEGMPGMVGDGSVMLTRGDVSTFGITFGSVEIRPLSRVIRTVGLVEFDETRMVYVSPKFAGWAERLHVDFTGQVVREGQPLLDVYAPELVTAQEELLLAARMAESLADSRVSDAGDAADELYAAARRRLQYWDVSDEQIDHLLEARQVSRTLTLYAPASGVVMEKNVFQGQAFEAGSALYMIADLSEVWMNAEVFEADAGLVREGMRADVTVEALPGQGFTGRIQYVYPTLADRTRSIRARVALMNPGGRLKPGMYGTVRITANLGEVLTIPLTAVLYTGERAVTFVDMGGGALMPQELELGVRGDGLVEVLAGVEPGQRVVTSAQFLMDSESNLAEVIRAMMAQMNLSDMEGMEGMDMTPPDTTGGR